MTISDAPLGSCAAGRSRGQQDALQLLEGRLHKVRIGRLSVRITAPCAACRCCCCLIGGGHMRWCAATIATVICGEYCGQPAGTGFCSVV